ncbi:MAG: cupin domain-containing protein [Mycoplasmatales bacterium]
MIVRDKSSVPLKRLDPLGGLGVLNGYEILNSELFDQKLSGFFINVLEVDSEIGFHQHVNNKEVYYIISGEGQVKDNDNKWIDVNKGDTLFTNIGEFHALKNVGSKNLEFLAFIIN